jgi:hypothetical protein
MKLEDIVHLVDSTTDFRAKETLSKLIIALGEFDDFTDIFMSNGNIVVAVESLEGYNWKLSKKIANVCSLAETKNIV